MAEHAAAAKDELTETGNDAERPADSADIGIDVEDIDAESETPTPTAESRVSPGKTALLVGLVIVAVVASLLGYLGFRTHQSQQATNRDNLFMQVARQGAVNLTTIDWQEADADIQRILESATGTFYDDFLKRSMPFVEVVKQAQSKSVGTVIEAGLERASNDDARVLVAVSVKTTNLGASEQEPRAWRMRIDVQKVGDQAKVSNVEFVP